MCDAQCLSRAQGHISLVKGLLYMVMQILGGIVGTLLTVRAKLCNDPATCKCLPLLQHMHPTTSTLELDTTSTDPVRVFRSGSNQGWRLGRRQWRASRQQQASARAKHLAGMAAQLFVTCRVLHHDV